MGYICKLIIDGEEQTFEYDSELLNKIITELRGKEIRIGLNRRLISVIYYSVCSKCGKLLLERIEVSTTEDNSVDKHICEYCSRYVDMY